MQKDIIQFQPKDVEKVITKWKEESKENKDARDWISCMVIHNLLSDCYGINHLGEMVLPISSNDKKIREYLKKFFIEDPVARAYAHNLYNLGRNYIHTCYEMIEEVTRTKEKENPKSLEKLSKEYHMNLGLITHYLPITPIMNKLINLNEKQKKMCNTADSSSEVMIYMGNRFFSPDFKRDKFYLEEDIAGFLTNVRKILKKEGISTIYGKVESLITKIDYLENVIEPLFLNAKKHAFNLDNDINRKMNEKNYTKTIGIFGRPEKWIDKSTEYIKGLKEPAKSGDYIVTIEDNGFGIKEEHIPRLFDKGFSTREEKDIAHGIGLWGAKQFVEKNGGKISVKTKLGEGTAFKFTIPYTHLDNHACAQD